MTIHEFSSTGDAYDACQCDDAVLGGDILIVRSEFVVGIAGTWPFAVSSDHGQLHMVGDRDALLKDYPMLPEAEKIAAEMGYVRDLSIGDHPVLIGRKWPTKIHHWKCDEFEGFLREHRFPANTWNDQQEARRQKAIDVQFKGGWVPKVVRDEDASIDQDVQMKKGSAVAWGKLGDYLRERSVAFQHYVGYTSSVPVYEAKIAQILESAIKQMQRIGPNAILVNHEGWCLTLTTHDARPAANSMFGASPKRLQISDGEDGLGVRGIHTIQWGDVDNALNGLLKESRVTLDEIWCFAGMSWRPASPAVVQVVAKSKGMGM